MQVDEGLISVAIANVRFLYRSNAEQSAVEVVVDRVHVGDSKSDGGKTEAEALTATVVV